MYSGMLDEQEQTGVVVRSELALKVTVTYEGEVSIKVYLYRYDRLDQIDGFGNN